MMKYVLSMILILSQFYCGAHAAGVAIGYSHLYNQPYKTSNPTTSSSSTAPLIVFEYNGVAYYIDDIDKFFDKYKEDICINTLDGPASFYGTLLKVCRAAVNDADKTFIERGAYKLARILSDVFGDSTKEQLRACLLTKERLQAHHQRTYPYQYRLSSDVEKCASLIGVHSDPESCPIGDWYVNDARYLDNLLNLTGYTNQTYSFSQQVSNPYVGIYNGHILLVCDGATPVYLVQPSFSGLLMCQGGAYESLPNTGSTPDGVYLVSNNAIEEINGGTAWGKYRMPLIPSKSTDTHGRTSMYLHGTTDKNKRQSGGCISLGVNIDEFVDDFFKDSGHDLVIIVNKVSIVDAEWNIPQ